MKNKSDKKARKSAEKLEEVKASDQASGKGVFLKGFVFSAVLMFVILWLLPVRYEINDEMGIVMTLNGHHGVPPDPYAPFIISQALHYVLCFLYMQWPSVPWLGMFMYFGVYLGCSLLLSLVFRTSDIKYTLLVIAPLVLFVAHCLAFISVTASALLLEFAVFLCLMEWMTQEQWPVKHPRLYALFLAFCFLLSYVFRWRLVLYSACFAIPVLFFVKKEQFRKVLPFVLVVTVFIACDRALFYFKSSPEHKAFAEYNQTRSVFNDTPKGQYHGNITHEALDKAGWSLEDYAFFRLWILYDEMLFNRETIRTFTRVNDPQDKGSLSELAAQKIKRSFKRSRWYTLVLGLSVFSLFLYRLHRLLRISRQDKLRIVFALGVLCLGAVFLMYYRFPGRIYVPLYTYLIGMGFLIFRLGGRPVQGEKIPTLRRIGVIAALLLMVVGVGFATAQGRQVLHVLDASQREKNYIHRCLADVKRKSVHHDPLLVLADPLYGLRFESVHPLKELSDFPDVRVFPGGSRINSPAYFDALGEIGLKGGREFLRWIIDNEEVLLVLMSRGGGRTETVKHLWESYVSRRIVPGKKVRLLPAHDFRNRDGAGLVFYSMVHAD